MPGPGANAQEGPLKIVRMHPHHITRADVSRLALIAREHAACLSYTATAAEADGDHAWAVRCAWAREDVLALASLAEHHVRCVPLVRRVVRAVRAFYCDDVP